MSKIIKGICPHCEKAIPETPKDKLLRYYYKIFAPLGIFSIIIVASLFLFPTQTSSFVSKFASAGYTFASNQNDLELREIALNITDGCSNSRLLDVCNAIKIYEELSEFDYQFRGSRSTVVYDPIYTYKTKKADCLQFSMLYCGLLTQVGGNCRVKCDYNKEHCWNIVKFKDNSTAKIDLTGPIFEYE